MSKDEMKLTLTSRNASDFASELDGLPLPDRLIAEGLSHGGFAALLGRLARLSGARGAFAGGLHEALRIAARLTGAVDGDALVASAVLGRCLKDEQGVLIVFLDSLIANVRDNLGAVLKQQRANAVTMGKSPIAVVQDVCTAPSSSESWTYLEPVDVDGLGAGDAGVEARQAARLDGRVLDGRHEAGGHNATPAWTPLLLHHQVGAALGLAAPVLRDHSENARVLHEHLQWACFRDKVGTTTAVWCGGLPLPYPCLLPLKLSRIVVKLG